MKLTPVSYADLNPRQKENFNAAKLAAVLADFGYVAMRLSADWKGADLIAQHIDGEFLKIQLKGRLTFCRKYVGKDLHIAFRAGTDWFLYPHDELLSMIDAEKGITGLRCWNEKNYAWNNGGSLSSDERRLLGPYKIAR